VTIEILTTPAADAQIEAADTWWREHRPSATDLFANELSQAFALIAAMPTSAPRFAHAHVRGLRRLFMAKTKYHVYDVYGGTGAVVLAVWSSRRGEGPRL
jgi:plasmid stabilization system protein ParE